MDKKQKQKAHTEAVKAGVKKRTAIQINTHAEIVRLLQLAQENIANTLLAQPSQYERWSLPNLHAEINRVLQDYGEEGAAVISNAAGEVWEAGQALIDAPLIAAEESEIVALIPRIDQRQLNAMRAFMTDRIKDIGVQAANKINSELGLVVIGSQSPGDAIRRVRDILGEPSNARARTIVRTQLGQLFSKATYLRMDNAKKAGVPISKKWLKSGKTHPRLNHNLAHGQIVPVDQPFLIPAAKGGSAIRMMHPHDPSAPAEEVINCGCTMVPAVDFSKPITPGGYQSSLKPTVDKTLDNDELFAQGTAFAERKGISPGKGLQAQSKLLAFANASLKPKVSPQKLPIGGIERWFQIKQATGLDLSRYTAVLDSQGISHITKHHGILTEKDKRQRAVTAADIAKVPDIINGYDKLTVSKTNRGLDALSFEKLIDRELYVYVAEKRPGKKHLATATMYIRRKRGGPLPK